MFRSFSLNLVLCAIKWLRSVYTVMEYVLLLNIVIMSHVLHLICYSDTRFEFWQMFSGADTWFSRCWKGSFLLAADILVADDVYLNTASIHLPFHNLNWGEVILSIAWSNFFSKILSLISFDFMILICMYMQLDRLDASAKVGYLWIDWMHLLRFVTYG